MWRAFDVLVARVRSRWSIRRLARVDADGSPQSAASLTLESCRANDLDPFDVVHRDGNRLPVDASEFGDVDETPVEVDVRPGIELVVRPSYADSVRETVELKDVDTGRVAENVRERVNSHGADVFPGDHRDGRGGL